MVANMAGMMKRPVLLYAAFAIPDRVASICPALVYLIGLRLFTNPETRAKIATLGLPTVNARKMGSCMSTALPLSSTVGARIQGARHLVTCAVTMRSEARPRRPYWTRRISICTRLKSRFRAGEGLFSRTSTHFVFDPGGAGIVKVIHGQIIFVNVVR
jgi:hypothetical protein